MNIDDSQRKEVFTPLRKQCVRRRQGVRHQKQRRSVQRRGIERTRQLPPLSACAPMAHSQPEVQQTSAKSMEKI